MLNPHRFEEVLTLEEWDIVLEALREFSNCDRWDEFDYKVFADILRYFENNR